MALGTVPVFACESGQSGIDRLMGMTNGMRNRAATALRCITDTMNAAAAEQRPLLAELIKDKPDRIVPRNPVACVLTQ